VAAAIVVRGGDPGDTMEVIEFDVGLAFRLNRSSDGTVNGVKSASIRDDTNAATSYLINGKHATAAIAVADSVVSDVVNNAVLIGTTMRSTAQVNATLVVQSSRSSTAQPLVWLGSESSLAHSVSIGNSEGKAGWFVNGGSAATERFLSGTDEGDTGVQILTTGKSWHVGGSAPAISVKRTTSQMKIGFFGADPVVRQVVAGTRDSSTLGNLLAALDRLGLTSP
jgi:hypothetical protein